MLEKAFPAISARDGRQKSLFYRVWIFIVDVDTNWRSVGNPEDSDFTLTGLTSGQTVKVRVTSANDAGESQPGPEAQFVVP